MVALLLLRISKGWNFILKNRYESTHPLICTSTVSLFSFVTISNLWFSRRRVLSIFNTSKTQTSSRTTILTYITLFNIRIREAREFFLLTIFDNRMLRAFFAWLTLLLTPWHSLKRLLMLLSCGLTSLLVAHKLEAFEHAREQQSALTVHYIW